MANLIAIASANWTTASTWGTVEAGANAVQNSITNITNTTTSYVLSPTFTCTNNDVMDGILLRLRQLSATGTFTVGFSADNGSTYAREVTINTTDIPIVDSWIFLKFGSTLTADGGSDYRIAVKSSSNGSVSVTRSSTTAAWARYIRLTATSAGAPTNADVIFVAGEFTAQATYNPITVTYDQTSPSPDFGAINICPRGLLQFGTAASTAYELKTSAIMVIDQFGEMTMGTTGTRIPSTSSASLIFDSATSGEFGISVLGTFRAHGTDKGQPWARLAANAAISATSLTLDRSVTWKSGETILIASTDGTQSHTDERALNADASGNSLAFTSGLTYAHDGTSLVPAAVVLYDRNVKIRGVDSTHFGHFRDSGTISVIECSWAEFYWLGRNTTNQNGVIVTGYQTATFTYCTFRNMAVSGAYILIGKTTSGCNLTFDYNVICNMQTGNSASFKVTGLATGQTNSVRYNIGITIGQWDIDADDTGDVSYNCVFQPSYYFLTCANQIRNNSFVFSYNEIRSVGVTMSYGYGIVFESCKFYDATATFQTGSFSGMSFLNCTWYEATYTINPFYWIASPAIDDTYVYNCTFTLGANNRGVIQTNNGVKGVRNRFVNCTQNGACYAVVWFYLESDIEILFDNCLIAALSPVGANSNHNWVTSLKDLYALNRQIKFMRFNQEAGNHFTWTANGKVSRDAVIYESPATSSERLVFVTGLASTAQPLRSATAQKKVASGATPTISVRVRKSVSTDSGGANYDGNQPVLVVKVNGVAAITSEIRTTASAAVGTWETLTATGVSTALEDCVIEAYVEILGTGSTVGWVNVGTWS